MKSENNLAYKTLITQEMLKKGYLAGNSIYVSIEHTEDKLERFFAQLDPVFGLIKECEEGRGFNRYWMALFAMADLNALIK